MNGVERLGETPDFLYVLDLDRTLIDSSVSARAVFQAAEELGVPRAELEEAQERIEGANQPFDVAQEIETHLASQGLSADELQEKMETIKSRFLDIIGQEEAFVYEGVTELVHRLEEESIPYVIATYGGETWQQWKLEAAGLADKDYIVTTTELEKGAWIAREWRYDDGTYAPPFEDDEHRQRLRAKHVVVVDDKIRSFEGLPDGNFTILVRHRGVPVRNSQSEGTFQPDLSVGSLWDVVARLNMTGDERS